MGGGEGVGGPQVQQILQTGQDVAAKVMANLPGALQAVPGDPIVARRAGVVAGVCLVLAAILGPIGVFSKEDSVTGDLDNFFTFLLAALTLVVELDLPQTFVLREPIVSQAKFLSTPLGLAGLHAVQGLLACAQAGVGYVLSGLVALVACILQVLVWHMRSVAATDDQGLIEGNYTPTSLAAAEEQRNRDLMSM